jgi:hypothetical protein
VVFVRLLSLSGFVSFTEFLHGFLRWAEDTADEADGNESRQDAAE